MNSSFEEQKRLNRARKKVESIKGFYKHFGVYILVNLFVLLAKLFSLKEGEEFFTFNNFSMSIFWGLGVAFHAFGVFGTNLFLGNNWEERKINEYMEKERTNNRKWQ